jgi:hypothetical protein
MGAPEQVAESRPSPVGIEVERLLFRLASLVWDVSAYHLSSVLVRGRYLN